MYKVNRRSTTYLQFYGIPLAKRHPEQRIRKWVTAENDRLSTKELIIARICSAHFATDEPS